MMLDKNWPSEKQALWHKVYNREYPVLRQKRLRELLELREPERKHFRSIMDYCAAVDKHGELFRTAGRDEAARKAVSVVQRMTEEPWGRIRARIWERDGGVCGVCGKDIPWQAYECGHIVDRCVGGTDLDSNLVAMCAICNRLKPVHETSAEYEAWVKNGYWKSDMQAYVLSKHNI